jgi:uncharacterized membrane-anchored protein YjiN (DUF445 family)
MEEKAKPNDDRHGRHWVELQEKTQNDPELAQQLEAIKHIMEENSEVLQRLADS